MTNEEHARAAKTAFQSTTVDYQTWLRNVQHGKYPTSGPPSQWGIGFAHLDAIADPATPSPAPTGVAAPGSTGLPVTRVPYTAGVAVNVQSSNAVLTDHAIDDGSGDSAVLVGSGGRFVSGAHLTRFRIRKAAAGNAVPWGKHGAYLDCFNSSLMDFDVECSSYAANGLSVRMGGMVITRAKISGAYFVFGFFDSDTGQSDGTVLVEDVEGSNKADTCCWCDAQDDFKTTFDLKLTFRRVHLSGSPAFLKASRVRNGTFRFESCTLNGQPLTPGQVPVGSVIV